MARVLKDSKIADMDLFPYRLFFMHALPPWVGSKYTFPNSF